MKSPAILCGLILSALTSAGFTHWWTVNEMIGQIRSDGVILSLPAPEAPAPAPQADPLGLLAKLPKPPEANAKPDAAQKEFFAALVDEIRGLRGENRDLRDQMAETNRDLMKLEFRVDTHSESFRPLPVSEGRFDTTLDTRFDDGPGVLPPRDGPFPFSAGE